MFLVSAASSLPDDESSGEVINTPSDIHHFANVTPSLAGFLRSSADFWIALTRYLFQYMSQWFKLH
jgi:hypothetical protein